MMKMINFPINTDKLLIMDERSGIYLLERKASNGYAPYLVLSNIDESKLENKIRDCIEGVID